MHLSPQIIERINGYFGYEAVQRIVLKHGLIKEMHSQGKERPHAVQRKLEASEIQEITNLVAEIPDENLQNALSKLGMSLMGRKNP